MTKDKAIQLIDTEYLYLKRLVSEYMKLFSNEDNIELMNTFCGGCFQVIQNSMNNEMILLLSRMLDSEKMGNNENLVLESLNIYLDDKDKNNFKKCLSDLRTLLSDCKLKSTRNKRLAHSDKQEKIEKGVSFLLINSDCLYSMVSDIEKLLKYFREKAHMEYVAYEHVVCYSGCETLIKSLKVYSESMKEN